MLEIVKNGRGKEGISPQTPLTSVNSLFLGSIPEASISELLPILYHISLNLSTKIVISDKNNLFSLLCTISLDKTSKIWYNMV